MTIEDGAGMNDDWLTPGAKVAILIEYAFDESVTIDEIDRVGKRDVVLRRTGERFNRNHRSGDGLVRYTGGTWGTASFLMPVDNAKVQVAIRRQRIRQVADAVEREIRALRRTYDMAHAAKAVQVLGGLIDDGRLP